MMKKMGRRCFVIMLLVAALLSMSFSQGYGRRVKVVRHDGSWHSNQKTAQQQQQHHHHHHHQHNEEKKPEAEKGGAAVVVGRQTVEMTAADYEDPKPNTNPKNGAIFNPPPSPPAPPQFNHH